jgi:hypothetical protein
MRNVSIIAEGPSGFGTKITLEDGTPIEGVRSVSLEISPNKVLQASLEVILEKIEWHGEARFYCLDIKDGKRKRITRITFEDGSEFVDA